MPSARRQKPTKNKPQTVDTPGNVVQVFRNVVKFPTSYRTSTASSIDLRDLAAGSPNKIEWGHVPFLYYVSTALESVDALAIRLRRDSLACWQKS
jgi:hypothetical protein